MTEERRKLLLEAALNDPELLTSIPPIVAAGFGVVPLQRRGNVLSVACFAGANRDALRALRDLLGVEVIATAFEDQMLHRAIARAYFPHDESLNFPTFLAADFLDDRRALEKLKQEKVELVGKSEVRLARDRIVLATLSYHTSLVNLDHARGGRIRDPRRTKLELRDDPLPFARDASGRPVVYVGEAPKLEVPLVAAMLIEYRFSDNFHLAPGALYSEHVLRSTPLEFDALPYVVHPTEVQLIKLEDDGALVFHAYDHEEVARPGVRTSFELTYFFLSYGNRLERTIRIDVAELEVAARGALAVRAGAPIWGPRELGRWLGVAT